ncbi:MAG: agmatine deiminase family protein [Aureliella sp.]
MNIVKSPHRWPAEWEAQAATWVAWPHNRNTWPSRFEPILPAFERFVLELSRSQAVHVLSGPAGAQPSAQERVGHLPNVTIHNLPTNDSWIRDYGPTFVKRHDDQSLVGINWHFNAWGGKYPPYDLDDAASSEICRLAGCAFSQSSLYCEGGALEGNGTGTIMTTSSCLRSRTRNPGWTIEMIEDELKVQLGAEEILWIDGGGLDGDDTDGHIDQIARFVAPGEVVAATSSRSDDPNYAGLKENVRILQAARTVEGEPLNVYELPTPPPRLVDGQRVPESYCNFVFAKGAVLVPTFRAETDNAALELLSQLLPYRRVIPIDSYDLAWGLGALHCLSQQQPAAN